MNGPLTDSEETPLKTKDHHAYGSSIYTIMHKCSAILTSIVVRNCTVIHASTVIHYYSVVQNCTVIHVCTVIHICTVIHNCTVIHTSTVIHNCTLIYTCYCVGDLHHVSPCGSFCVVSKEREKTDRRDSRGDERERHGRKRKMNESEATKQVKTSASTLTCCKDNRPCQNCNIRLTPR